MFNRSTAFGLLAGTFLSLGGAVAFAGTATDLTVDMWNKQDGSQGITLSTNKVAAGTVNFVAHNSSPTETHEFIVVKTDLPIDQFADNADGTKIDESKLKGTTELGDLKPGESGTLTLNLEPGRYVVFCNEVGHFHAGMYAELNVN